jgi:hypothetical protein
MTSSCPALTTPQHHAADGEYVSQETHEFVKKVFEKSGIDNNGSYLPQNLHPQHTLEPHGGQDESFAEARLVMGGAVRDLLDKTGQQPVCLGCKCSAPHNASVVIYCVIHHIIKQRLMIGGVVQD